MSFNTRGLAVLLASLFLFSALLVIPGLAVAATHEPVVGALVPPFTEHRPSTVTDADGLFRFEGLERGTHQLYLDVSSLPASLRPGSDASEVVLWLNPGQSFVSDPIGAGVRISATYDHGGTVITGVVFIDQNDDGRQNPGEVGLADLTVIDPTIHQYFIPFDDQDLIALLDASNECQPSTFPVGSFLASRISLTASSDGTMYYYDHWEDGYDADPMTPGPTTMVSMLDAGMTRVFEDDINTADPNWGTTLYYDGRDRITIFGEPASVIRAVSPSLTDSAMGTMLAGAWEIDETANWGTEYIIPAGEDWGVGSDFEFTGATFTALQDGTQISRNGSPVGLPLNAGQTLFVNGGGDGAGGGGLDSGDAFAATGLVQVHLYSSICTTGGGIWSGNGYTLEPRDHWTGDFWSPVPRRISGPTCRNDADMDIFVYNDTSGDINLTIDDGTIYNVTLPPGSWSVADLISPAVLSDTRGVHIEGDGPFWGVVDSDTRDTAHEWGYSLIPADELSSQVVLGWAPGNDLKPPVAQYPPNGNMAFVMAVVNTVVFADFDQDGTADPMDCNGDGDANDLGVDGICDEPTSSAGVPLTQGQTLRVADPVDADMTGALIYTTNLSEKLAVAWGQDSCVAAGPLPYIDMGYTVLPVAAPSVFKDNTMVIDVDESGDTSPGDILEYTILVLNNGQGPMSNFVMTDTLPYTYTDFVFGSITVTSNPPLPAPGEDYFDGASWTYTPTPTGTYDVDPAVQQFRLSWPTLAPGQIVTTTFRMQIQYDVPSNLGAITNVVLFGDGKIPPPETSTGLGEPILQIDKLPSDPTTVAPGETLTYTVVVSNVGTATALSALAVDNLPPWGTYITDTLDLTWPTAHVITTATPISHVIGSFNLTIGDNFDMIEHLPGTTGFAGSDGTLPWLDDWTEINDNGLPGTGDIRVIDNAPAANSPTGYLQLTDRSNDDLESGLQRCANLSGFAEPHLSYQMRGVAQNSDVYRVVVTSTTALTTLTFSELYGDTTYAPRDLNLSDFADDSSVCIAFIAGAGMEGTPAPIDQYRVDDVFIYDAAPERYDTFYMIAKTTVISYTTLTDINPVAYTRIPPDPRAAATTHTMQFTNTFPFPPQSSLTATFQVRVGYPLTDGLQMVNTACITATNVYSTPYPLCDDETTRIQSDHVLTITKTDEPDPAFLSRLLTYSLFWEVAGDEPAPGVVVTDSLPLPYVTYVSCAPLPECQGETSPGSGVVTWDLGDRLQPMSGVTYDSGWLTLTVRVDQRPPGGVFTNTVIIDDETDTTPDEDDEPTTVPEASFYLTKQRVVPITRTARINDTVVFQIAITNTGVLTITRLPLEDTYDPVYLEYRSASPSPDSVSPGLLVWNDLTPFLPGSVLPPGHSTQVMVTFTAISSTQRLDPPVTVNTAATDGAETEAGQLPRQEDDDVVEIGIPTAIELLYFRANPRSGGVLVEWATLLEIDTFGFWLYRGDDANFSHSIPVAFVAAKGWHGLGAVYQYLDPDLPSGLYHYWLVEVENSGDRTTYGPTSTWSGWDVAELPYRIYLPLVQRP